MAKDEGESPDDWTDLVQTRVSSRASKAMDDFMKEHMLPSKAAAVRKLIYTGLGLIKKES